MKKLFTLVLLPYIFFGCSSHPEIKPYENAENNSYDLNENKSQTLSDSVFNDNSLALEDDYYDDSPVPTEFDDRIDVAEESSDIPAPKEKRDVKITSPQRSIASTSQNGFFRFTKDCTMRSAPENTSSDAGKIPYGKRLWLDVHNSQWYKAYKKAGTVYVSSGCVRAD